MDRDRPAPPVSYVLRTLPVPSETFVVRELLALRDAGAQVEIWSLLRAGEQAWSEMPEAGPLRPLVREVPGGLIGSARMLGALGRWIGRHPRRTGRAVGWALLWTVRGRDLRTLAALPYAAWIAQHASARHLHAHFANTPTTVAVLAAMLSGRTCSYTGHARDLWAVTTPAFLAAKTRRCAFAASGTQYAVAHIRDACGSGPEPAVALVRNIVETSTDDGIVAREPGLVICVARLVEKKGVDTLIRAVDEASRLGSQLRLELVGDGPCRAELEALTRSLGMVDRVTFRGALSPVEVGSALDRAQIFALLARQADDGDTDGLPVALLEAQAHGLPVLSTRVAGIPEAVEDGATGLLVPHDDPAAATAALRRLADDRDLRGRLGPSARDAVAARHDAARVASLLLERFHQAGRSRNA